MIGKRMNIMSLGLYQWWKMILNRKVNYLESESDSELVVSVSELEGLPKCFPNSGLMESDKFSIVLMPKVSKPSTSCPEIWEVDSPWIFTLQMTQREHCMSTIMHSLYSQTVKTHIITEKFTHTSTSISDWLEIDDIESSNNLAFLCPTAGVELHCTCEWCTKMKQTKRKLYTSRI